MGVADLESHGSDDGASVHDTELKTRQTHRVPVPNMAIPHLEHINALHAFLTMHSLNLQTLQKAHEIPGKHQSTALKGVDQSGRSCLVECLTQGCGISTGQRFQLSQVMRSRISKILTNSSTCRFLRYIHELLNSACFLTSSIRSQHSQPHSSWHSYLS